MSRASLVTLAFLLLIGNARAGEESNYRVGPGDVLSVWCLGAEEISEKPLRVDTDGFLDAPLIGRMDIKGRTLEEVRELLAERLKVYVKNVSLTVTVVEFRSQPVSVLGQFNTPGTLQLQGEKNLLEVISMAGGLKPEAGHILKVLRRKDEGPFPLRASAISEEAQHYTAEISVRELIEVREPALNIRIRPHDVISVPKAELFYVMGEVRKPGGFVLGDRDQISIIEAVSLAEGTTGFALASKTRLFRRQENSIERKEIALNLSSILNGKSSEIFLTADDILIIPSNTAKKVSIRAAEAAIQLGVGVLIWR